MGAVIHKLELYVVGANGNYDNIDEIINMLERNTDGCYHISNQQTVKFKWDDDLDINNVNATTEDYEKYFKG